MIPMLPRHLARLTLCLATTALTALPAAATELAVHIDGIAATGTVHVYVYTKADGFPKEEAAALHTSYPVDDKTQTALDVKIEAPEAAEYALVAYQDKDGNGKMNRLLGMIPQEPYGLSQNPKLFGKPKFGEAAFKPKDGEVVVIHLKD
jgi:uncharacterized protein (DUF2141 family)